MTNIKTEIKELRNGEKARINIFKSIMYGEYLRSVFSFLSSVNANLYISISCFTLSSDKFYQTLLSRSESKQEGEFILLNLSWRITKSAKGLRLFIRVRH